MKSFMWVITMIVLLTATSLTATTTEDNNDNKNSRSAKFAKGEIPLLIIRPVHRPSGSSQRYSRIPVAQSRVSYPNDDLSLLGSILPQLGYDPNLFSAFHLGGSSGGQSKKHLVPIHQNEIPKYHTPSNYKSDIHLSFKESDFKPSYSFNYDSSPPALPPPPPSSSLSSSSSTHHSNIPKPSPLIGSFSGHGEPALNQNERYLDQPLFIPTNNMPSEISDEYEESYSKPLNNINFPPPQAQKSYSYSSINVQSHNNNYKPEKYFEPKPIDFNLVKSKEELVIGKPTAPINLHAAGYKSNEGNNGNNNFYIPKHENTASFEVKSKTENVQFVPEYVTKHNENSNGPSFPSSGQQNNYNKASFELFKQTPKTEYFIPKEQNTAAVKVSSDAEEYYKRYETDDYFLPKLEPDYHKLAETNLYRNKPITTTTQQPPTPPTPPKSDVPERYSFMINDDGYSDIHIQDHVYAEPEQLYYGYDGANVEGTEKDQNEENHFSHMSFYPSNHKEFDSKMSALDYVQSSMKSNLNHLFNDYEYKKSKLISSTYKKEDFTEKPELNFGSFVFPTSTPQSKPEQLKITDYQDYKDASYYFAKSSEDHDELNSYYSTLKQLQSVETTPPTTYERPSFSLKAGDVRPIYEPYYEEHSYDKSAESSYENNYEASYENSYENESNPPGGKLYLNEREPDNYENEVSTISPKLFSAVTEPTTEDPVVSSTKLEIKFPNKYTTPKITTYKSRYSPTFRPTTTEAPYEISSTTHKSSRIETTTIDSGVNLLSGVACERQCIRNTVSQEYDPVCGSDNKTYSNKGKLRCTRTCGKSDLHVKHYGGCGHK